VTNFFDFTVLSVLFVTESSVVGTTYYHPDSGQWWGMVELFRATADLVCGRVSSRVPAWLFALSRYASIIRCLFSYFDWTSRYGGGSSKMITTQGLLKTASSATLLP